MKCLICDMSGIASIKGKNNQELLNVFQNFNNLNYTFCTGKGFKGSLNTIQDLDLYLPIICENGALMVSKDGQILSKHIIDFEEARKLVIQLSKLDYDFISCCNIQTNNYIFLQNNKRNKEELNQDIFFGEEMYYNIDGFLKAIENLEIVRIIYKGNIISEKIINTIKNFDISNSEKSYYSFCTKGINKKKGIEELISRYNISKDDIIIIGNDYNDICMFDIECYKKIAVSEECSELKQLADVNISLTELPNYLSNLDKNS